MRFSFLVFFLLFFAWACLPKEEQLSTDPILKLAFSTDTLQFDTLISGQKSTFEQLQVYNRAEKAIEITQIRLAGGDNSPYQVIINGNETTTENNIRLLGKDSLLIIVQYHAQATNENAPVAMPDSLIFLTNGNEQEVKCQAATQDVYRFGKHTILQDTTLKADRPFLLTDTLTVAPAVNLTIEAGATFLAQQAAAVNIFGSLQAQGTNEQPIVFRNEKLTVEAPSQWPGIHINSPTGEINLQFTEVRNAQNSLCIQNSTMPVMLKNCQLINQGGYGLLINQAEIHAENSIFSKSGKAMICSYGGAHFYGNHLTINGIGSSLLRRDPLIKVQPEAPETNSKVQANAPHFELINSIVWGANQEEISIEGTDSPAEIIFSLLKTQQDFGNTNLYNNYFSSDLFQNIEEDNYKLKEDSPQIDQATPTAVKKDFLDRTRDEKPDIGAFEFIAEEDLTPTE